MLAEVRSNVLIFNKLNFYVLHETTGNYRKFITIEQLKKIDIIPTEKLNMRLKERKCLWGD